MFPAAGLGISKTSHAEEIKFLFFENILFDGVIPALMVGSLTQPHLPPDNPDGLVAPDIIMTGSDSVFLNGIIPCPFMGSSLNHGKSDDEKLRIISGIDNVIIGL